MPGTVGPARPLWGRTSRLLAAVAAVIGSAAVAAAQAPRDAEPPGGRRAFVPPLGATSGLPNVSLPDVPTAAPPADVVPLLPGPTTPTAPSFPTAPLIETQPVDLVPGTMLPPTVLEVDPFPPAPTPAEASATPTDPVFGPRKPLPGSLADQVQRDYAARDLFRYCTWRDCTITMFPTTLLWEPPLAIFREPRMQALWTSQNNYKGPETLETSLGADFGVFRFEPIGSDFAVQLDLFGVAHTRLSPDDVMAQSYRFGFPVTFRRGPWHGKIGYEHTSDHLGDELIFNTGRQFTRYAKDELVMALGRYFYDRLRVYGQWSYAGYQDLPQGYNRNRYDAGFEYYDRRPTGFTGTPFLAFNATWRGEQQFTPITTTQFGWLWRNEELRLASLRIFGAYYSGGSPYGQFFQDGREHWWAIGIAGDY